ncbi:hypothetical protein SAMN05421788_11359 [Filimonas lacunae]|uniref:Uncharacterized protein n=1 Tax=Filimonas lacunae TaxID=477680 RepID=A0A1N7RF42_9BACT|nr:hypothetical protein [Filimonas lacunae]SIT33699.1 hypothetical protein SAMN05421788_11359 [Filimonas lacunae]
MKKKTGIDTYAVMVFDEIAAWCQRTGVLLQSIFPGEVSRYQQVKKRIELVARILEEGMSAGTKSSMRRMDYFDEVSSIIVAVADKHKRFQEMLVGKGGGNGKVSQFYKARRG